MNWPIFVLVALLCLFEISCTRESRNTGQSGVSHPTIDANYLKSVGFRPGPEGGYEKYNLTLDEACKLLFVKKNDLMELNENPPDQDGRLIETSDFYANFVGKTEDQNGNAIENAKIMYRAFVKLKK